MFQDPRNVNKGFFVKLNMLKKNLKDKRNVEKFSVQRGLTIFDDLGSGEKQYHTEYFVNESLNPIHRAGYDKFLNNQYHMSLM